MTRLLGFCAGFLAGFAYGAATAIGAVVEMGRAAMPNYVPVAWLVDDRDD
jgi:hypothetical protein